MSGNEGPCTEPYGSSPQEATYIVEAKLIEPLIDSDADGVIDEEDAFPDDPAETHDDDGDGVGNNTDLSHKTRMNNTTKMEMV